MNTPENLVSLLVLTLDPDRQRRRKASEQLESLEKENGFCLQLLQVIDEASSPNPQQNQVLAQQSAAVYFKNYVKKHWTGGSGITIPENDKQLIRSNIVELMCKVPKNVSSQLGESVKVIGESDFHENWTNLLPDIKNKLSSTSDSNVINGMMETLNTLFKMLLHLLFRDKESSDPLFLKLKYVLENFQQDLLNFLMKVGENLKANEGKNSLEMLTTMRLLSRIFYSLSWQTIPEFFEDNLQSFMHVFEYLLSQVNYATPNFVSDDARVMHINVQSAVISSLQLYAKKYDEEFGPFMQGFTQETWTLLVNCGQEEEFDELVSNAMGFLSTLIQQPMNKSLFSGEGVLNSICEKVILPSLVARGFDVEKFEDNPLDYVRGDLEGGDKTSRKNTGMALIRAASKHFEPEIRSISMSTLSGIFKLGPNSGSMTALLKSVASIADEEKRQEELKKLDVGITLFISIAAKKYTYAFGVDELREEVGFNDFFQAVISPVLALAAEKNSDSHFALLSSNAIKFLVVFRRQVEKNAFPQVIEVLLKYMESDFFVVYTYACICLEKYLSIRDNKVDRYTVNDIQPKSGELLTTLFNIIERNISKNNEYNEYAMRTVLKLIIVLGSSVGAQSDIFMSKLVDILVKTCSNPQNPVFNHYLFDSIAAIIKAKFQSGSLQDSSFEEKLFPLFQQILQQDVSELSSYVFQIMAQLLELNASTTPNMVSGYMSIFPALLSPVLWQNKGNSIVLVRLLKAFLSRQELRGKILENPKNLEGLLGIFQKLLSASSTEQHGFKLLIGIIQFVDHQAYSGYLKDIFQLIFTKFQSSKPGNKSKQQFCVFLAVLASKISRANVQRVIAEIPPQGTLFDQVVEYIYLAGLGTFGESAKDRKDKKAALLGAILILTEDAGYIQDPASVLGAKILHAVLSVLSKQKANKKKGEVADDFQKELLQSLEETGYSSSHSTLVHSTGKNFDPFPEVGEQDTELGKVLVTKLVELQSKTGCNIKNFLDSSLKRHPDGEVYKSEFLKLRVIRFAK
eukprot:maker-scaffold_1-snap-gene-19.30-mRNA-1 protein AED:0.39 eAED:0.56 QI:0/0/0.25/1/0.33/0.25/4/64/1024